MHNFQVSDMTCGHCASTVERAVNSADAGAKIRINLSTHRVEISSEKPAAVFAAAISAAGYTGELQP